MPRAKTKKKSGTKKKRATKKTSGTKKKSATRKTSPTKKKRASGKTSPTVYTFEGPAPVTDGEFAVYADNGVFDAQYLETATVHAGKRIRDPEHYAQVDEHDIDPDVARFASWRVLAGKTHVFDIWVVHVDGAIVFEADSATRTPINVIQGSWQTTVNKPKWTAICRDLEASAPTDLWF